MREMMHYVFHPLIQGTIVLAYEADSHGLSLDKSWLSLLRYVWKHMSLNQRNIMTPSH